MKSRRNIVDIFLRNRSALRRNKRLLFPSPAELRFIELFGGKVWRSQHIFSRSTKFPMAVIYKKPNFFKSENLKREVRIGKYYVDFGVRTPYYKRAIEIDGQPYHMDVVAEQDRDIYTYARGWKTLRIRAYRLYNDSSKVQDEVIRFLTK